MAEPELTKEAERIALERTKLERERLELDPFLDKAKANGPQTAALVADVVKRRGES